MAFHFSRLAKRQALIGLLLGGGCAIALTPIGCSSDSSAKKIPGKFTPDGGGSGGEAGQTTNGAGSGGKVGTAGSAGTSGNAGSSGEAGASTGGGGEAGAGGGEAGAAGAPNQCPAGYGDCDTNPADCETPLTLITSCGACNTSCDGSHASVACKNDKCVVNNCSAGYGDCDNDPVTGCETPTDTDTHCGSCARNCAAAGTTCNTGKCAAITVDPLGASGFQGVLSGDSLYTINTGSMPVGNVTITRIPLNGSAATKLVDNEAGGSGQGVLNVDASFIYWSIAGSPPSVLKKSITAASTDLDTVVFHPVANPHFLSIQGGAYYWMTVSSPSSTLYSRATSAAAGVTGTQIVTTDQGYVSSFRVTTDSVYWVKRPASTSTLVYVPLAGGTPVQVPGSSVADSAPLYSVGNTLYFVQNVGTTPENGIYKFTPGDASATQLVQANAITNLIVDATYAYYTIGYDGLVYKAPLTMQNGVPIASGFSGYFGGQDATYLYAYAAWGSDGPLKKIVK